MARKASPSNAPYIREFLLNRERVPSFGSYPFSLPAVRNLHRLPLHPAVTFIIGENGSGKSTLLEALAVCLGFNAEGGSLNFNFSTRASHSDLCDCISPVREPSRPSDGFFLRAESFFNMATEIENLDREGGPGPPIIEAFGGKSLHEQSHGESFLSTFIHRFRGHGLYILDEPEAALSPTRQMSFIARLHQLVHNQSQFIIATHSPILMSYPNADLIELSPEGMRKVDFRDTEHYTITKAFLDNPEGMLSILMGAAADVDECRTNLNQHQSHTA